MNIFSKLFSPWDYTVINKLKELDQANNLEDYLNFTKVIFKKVKVIDNNDPILPLKEYLNKDIQINLCNLKIDDSYNQNRLFLRKTVIDKLNQAQKLLPKGYHLMIRDAFRSEALVWELYHLYCNNLKQINPNLSDKEIDIEVRSRIAIPDDSVPPGHMTGGAVDVVLGDDNCDFIPTRIFGTDFINSANHQYTFCKDLPTEMHNNRMILYNAMIKVGFSNISREYWHYSYGDGNWASKRKKKIAIYGIPKINK